jgi:hypothetical protein
MASGWRACWTVLIIPISAESLSSEVQRLRYHLTATDSPLAAQAAVCPTVVANCFESSAERFVRSIKEECLERLFPIAEQHFSRAVAEYVGRVACSGARGSAGSSTSTSGPHEKLGCVVEHYARSRKAGGMHGPSERVAGGAIQSWNITSFIARSTTWKPLY